MLILPTFGQPILVDGYASTDAAPAYDNISSDMTYSGGVPSSISSSVIATMGVAGGPPTANQSRAFFALLAVGENTQIAKVEVDRYPQSVGRKEALSGPYRKGFAPFFLAIGEGWDSSSGLRMYIDWQGEAPVVVNAAYGNAYEFPCIENTQLSPAQFNKDVVYNNNISSKGQFLGRTAVRRGATVTLKPLSFIATVDRMNEILELFEKLETRACYVHYKVADKDFVHYGWTESEPNYQYTADEEYVQVSFTLRCPA